MARTSRRGFMQQVAAGTAASAFGPGLLAAAQREGGRGVSPPKSPNIVWISAEDISPTVGCYGDAYATTPNLDRFASQGVRFEWAFTHAPVCAPARSGVITGMYPTTIGTTWMRCQGVPPPEARCFPEYLRVAGYFCTNNRKTDYQFAAPPSAWDINSNAGHWRKRPDPDQPFFSVFNFGVTHESSTRRWQAGQHQHDPTEAPVPPYYPDTPIVRQNIACYYDRIGQLDTQVQRVLDELEADGLADDTIVWFWGDHGWGLTRGKRWVYDSGVRVPLMVRVPEKYREWAGAGNAASVAPGAVEEDFARFIDFAPTVLSLAGVPVPEHMQGRAFLGPQKGTPPEYVFSARDRMDETIDRIRSMRDKQYKYIRNFMPYLSRGQHINYMDQTPILQEMRRLHAEGKLPPGPQMQFLRPEKPAHELYDLTRDPHEINNLADDPKYADVVERMGRALVEQLKAIGDVGLLPECEFDAIKGDGRTAAPGFTVKSGGREGRAATVALSCTTPGASIVYEKAGPRKAGGEGGRSMLYAEPVEVRSDEMLRARACRLGYANSPVATYRPGEEPTPPEPTEDKGPYWRERLNRQGVIEAVLALKAYDGRWAEGVPTYLEALSSPHGPVRYWAVVGLHQSSPDGPPEGRIKSAVERLLDDPAPSVPVAAAEALVDWGEPQRGLARLADALAADLEKTRLLAAWSLDALGEKARPILDRMQEALKEQPRYPGAVLKRVVEKLRQA